MTREEAGQKAKIMQAYSDGKDIEYYDVISEQWINKKEPSFDDKACHYRVKVDPKYRPFKDAKECFDEMKKHEPFGWVKYGEEFIFIPAIVGDRITILTDDEVRCLNFRECFVEMTFIDDTPFGIKEEEES